MLYFAVFVAALLVIADVREMSLGRERRRQV